MPRGNAGPIRAHGGRDARLRRAVLHGACGGLIGYTVLHPVTMAVFRALDGPSLETPALGRLLRAMAEAFHPHMLPMGAVFALLLAAAGAGDGWLRGLVLEQRRELAHLVRRLEVRHQEMERLHAAHRRSMRFLVHDLKTHIGCIQGFAELLRSSPAVAQDPESADAALRISRQANKLMEAVTDLLELARLEEVTRPRKDPVELSSLMAEVEETFAGAVAQGRLRIETPEVRPLAVLGDRRVLRRVVCNLVSNALSFATEGGPALLTIRRWEEHTGWIEISCTDHGPGIPPEELPHVFEEFRSGRGSSGLGLAFCRAAVQAHGGTIDGRSSPEGGCTFTVRLPEAVLTQEE